MRETSGGTDNNEHLVTHFDPNALGERHTVLHRQNVSRTRNMETTEILRNVPPQPRPTFGTLVGTYIKHGNRDYLARLLQVWSPAMDELEGTALMGGALHRAIFIGDETAVRMILEAGVSPTVQDSQLYSPLATAAEAGHRVISRLLWELVGPNGRAAPLRSPNCLLVAAEKSHADLVADYLDMWDGWPMDEKRQALYSATGDWLDGVVGVLLAKVAYEADTIQKALEVGVTKEPILPVAR